MIDDKKIEAAVEEYNKKVENELEKKHIPKRTFAERYAESAISEYAFKTGAKWAISEFLNDLWHPASEEPKNLEYIIFTNDIFGEIYFFTMQRDNSLQSWETEVAYHDIDQWAYRNDIVSLILKGGKQ